MSEVLLTHINLVVLILVLMDDSVEELLLHCVVSDIIDFIIKQVSRTRPMISDDESYSLTCTICRCDQSSAGAISLISLLNKYWEQGRWLLTTKVTRSHESSAGAINHLLVRSLIDFIIKQVSRTRPMIADDECYSLTWIMCRVWSIICWCDLK